MQPQFKRNPAITKEIQRHKHLSYADVKAQLVAYRPAYDATSIREPDTYAALMFLYNVAMTIRRAGRFTVNILADHQDQICRQLGRPGADKFEGVEWTASENGSPLLTGALATIDCELHDEVDGGDHTVVIARVTGLNEHSEATPLLFYRAAFGRLAHQ